MKKNVLFYLSLMFLMNINVFSQKDAFSILASDYPFTMDTAGYGNRLKAQKADYIIAIDVSGTMNKHKDMVVPALKSFLESIPDGDYVSFIKFGAKAVEFGMSGTISSATRSSFYDYPEQIYTPDAEFSGATDLFLMAGKVADFLSRPEANDLKYVFMFTDFIHEPASAASVNQWSDLGKKVESIYEVNTVRVFAMKLPGANTGRDIGMIKKRVFPNLQTIDVDNAPLLNSWFQSQKADIYKNRLIDLILGDFERYIISKKIQFDGKLTCTGKMKLIATFAKDLPDYYKAIVIEGNDIKYKRNFDKFKSYPRVILSRKQTDNNDGECQIESKTPLCFGLIISDSVTGKMMFTSTFQKEVEKLGIADKFVLSKVIDAQKGWIIAWPLWVFILTALALVILIALTVINCILPTKLKHYVAKIDDGDPIKLGNRSVFEISKGKSANYQLKTHDDITILVFITRADPFNLFVKHHLSFRVKSKKPMVTIDKVMQVSKSVYLIPLLKNIRVEENLSSVQMFFFLAEKSKKKK